MCLLVLPCSSNRRDKYDKNMLLLVDVIRVVYQPTYLNIINIQEWKYYIDKYYNADRY
jgi:hypothetical protein